MSDNRLRVLHDNIYEKLLGKDFANGRARNSVTSCMLGIAPLKEVFDKLQVDFNEACGVDVEYMLDRER